MPQVRVETVEIDSSGNRQISARERATSLLAERSADIEAAIEEATGILSKSAEALREPAGWRVSSFEASFGIALSAEAGAFITKASAEASIEITISIERTS